MNDYNMLRKSLLIVLVLLSGCGKYGKPLAPELLSPQAARKIEISAGLEGVRFKWEAPEKDQRGRELKEIQGYRIMRKDLVKLSDLLDDEVEEQEIGSIVDTHLAELKRLRDQAEAEGKPVRKVKVDQSLKHFEFIDSTVKPGSQYAYKIVPINQGGVEGQVSNIYKVLFKGENSEIVIIPQISIEEEGTF